MHTDKKRKSNFPNIQGNSEWSICKVIYEEGLPNTYEEMRKYFPIYEEDQLVIYTVMPMRAITITLLPVWNGTEDKLY